NGARDVVAAPVMGKGYLEIDMNRDKASRYGVSVEDVKNTVEVALGGQAITQTVEGRNRFPVRLRYPRALREDEETVKRLLVRGRAAMPGVGAEAMKTGAATRDAAMSLLRPDTDTPHQAAPPHGTSPRRTLQVPL